MDIATIGTLVGIGVTIVTIYVGTTKWWHARQVKDAAEKLFAARHGFKGGSFEAPSGLAREAMELLVAQGRAWKNVVGEFTFTPQLHFTRQAFGGAIF